MNRAAGLNHGLELEIRLPRLQVKTSLPLPTYGPLPYGPVLITVAPRISLAGAATAGKSQTTVALTPGQRRADFEQKVSTTFGKVSLTGGIEPGKASKVGIKIGTELVEVEFAAQANLTEPLVLTLKPRTPLKGTLRVGDWTFEGNAEVSVAISVSPNPAWPGWAAVARGTASASRGVVAVARGLFFAGEVATATTLGAMALGAGLAAGGILWVGLSLYMIGKAHQDARILRMGLEFCNGYSEMLANVTSGQPLLPDTRAGQQQYWRWQTFDWRSEFEEQGRLWVRNEDKNALWRIRNAGRMAAVQDFALFLQLYGPEAWKRLSEQHRARYGGGSGFRKQAYLRVLYRQVKQGKPIGIPLTPPGERT